MNRDRYWQLSFNSKNSLFEFSLTAEEKAEGWHFCPDWDYMLIGPGMPECDACTCEIKHDQPNHA